MRNLFIAGLLFFMAGCTSNQSKSGNSDTAKSTNQGNSAGSDITATDTMHIDTSSNSTSGH